MSTNSGILGIGLLALGLILGPVSTAMAQDGRADLATAATNPVGSANQLQRRS